MRNKLLMLCISAAAVGAFAALPAIAAAASPSLLDDSGAVVTPHSGAIKGVSTNLLFTTSSGKLECAKTTLEGELTVNAGNVVEGDISTATFLNSAGGTKCPTSLPGPVTMEITPENLPWCLEATASPVDTLTIDGGTCGTTPRKSIAYIAHVFTSAGTKVGECTYERASLTLTYKTNTTPLVATLSSGQTFTKASGGILCTSTVTLSGSFTLTTGTGTGLKVV
jgi:hypothetical protein